MLPKDPVMLLSFVNTQLRDNYKSLTDFCKAFDIKEGEITDKLNLLDYHYNAGENQFR